MLTEPDLINFYYEGNCYAGATAAEIVRQIAASKNFCSAGHGSFVRQFLDDAHRRLADSIPSRELSVGAHLPDEDLAFNYLCLLEQYGFGSFSCDAPVTEALIEE